MVLGVQQVAGDALPLQHVSQKLVLLDRYGTYQHGLSFGVALFHLTDHGAVFAVLGLINAVIIVDTGDGAVGGDFHNIQLVDGGEFLFLRQRRTGHTGELAIHTEIVLECDGGQRFALPLHLHPLLGLDGLMETLVIAAAEHETACELVHDDDLAVLYHIVHIPFHDAVGTDGLIDVVGDGAVLRITQIVQMEELLRLGNAPGGKGDAAGLFIHDVIGVDVGIFLLLGVGLHDGEALELAGEGIGHVVELGGLVALAGDDEGGAGFIDQDGVHLVHDGEVVSPLHQLVGIDGHVVPQVVKAHLVVGAVSNIGVIGLLALLLGQIVDDQTHAQPQKTVNLAHPLAVALGKVVVDGDDMDALAGQGVQIGGQSGHQCLAFTGLHFGDTTLMQHDAAHQLYGVGAHPQYAVRRLPDGGKGLRQNVVQCFAVLEAFLEFRRFGLQLGVGQRLILLLHALDLVNDGPDGFQLPFGIGSENFGDQSHVF